VHRWFIGGDATHADSYISAVRLGNSSWVFSDLAKVGSSTVQAREAARRFFRSFSEHALVDPSISTLLMSWVEKHPLWHAWGELLEREHPELICARASARYFRFQAGRAFVTRLQLQRIEKEDYKLRREIMGSLGEELRKLLFHAFDFEEAGVGSCFLAQTAHGFEREYVLVTHEGLRFLAVLSRVPYGLSMNRFADSLFLVPLDSLRDEARLEERIPEMGTQLSVEFGMPIPSIRLIHDGTLPEGGTPMTCFLLYPRAFFHYE
jgi:hypothetical protein